MSINRTVENVYIRQDAVQLTRKHFWPLVGMSIIVNVIINVVHQGLTEIGDLLMIPEVTELTSQISYLSTSGKLTSSEPLLNAATALFFSPKFILFNLIFMLVTGLVSAGLALGRTREMIDAVRGGSIRATGVFGLMRYCFKALLLNIWTSIKAILWMLPGVAVSILGGALVSLDLAEIGELVTLAGAALMLSLFIPALLRYVLATPLLADEPNLSIRECVKRSSALMKDRKWQFCKVGIPAWLKIIGMIIAASVCAALLEMLLELDYSTADLLSTVLITAATIYLSLQLDMVYIAFYERVRWPNPADKPVKPVSYWLREHTETDIEEAYTETPAESGEDSPVDISPETNEEKENSDEEPDR